MGKNGNQFLVPTSIIDSYHTFDVLIVTILQELHVPIVVFELVYIEELLQDAHLQQLAGVLSADLVPVGFLVQQGGFAQIVSKSFRVEICASD